MHRNHRTPVKIVIRSRFRSTTDDEPRDDVTPPPKRSDGCGGIRLASVPELESRLEQLRAEEQPVRLDLSRLGFMDSTGIHLLISAFNHSPADGWQFEVDSDLSRPVEQLFRLTDVERITAATG